MSSSLSDISPRVLYLFVQLRKTDMLRKGQEDHVRAERDVLKSASLVSSTGGAEWIVRLRSSFQELDNLYLVRPPVFYVAVFPFDLMPNRSSNMGGDDLRVLNLLIERDTFPEDCTRFSVAEV